MPVPPDQKPVSEVWRPELVLLPGLTPARRFFRRLVKSIFRLLVATFTRISVSGLENYPGQGPALITMNHLGDPDAVLVLSVLPDFPEMIAKIELHDIKWLGLLADWLGVIWVHRGKPDRRAINASLEALHNGRRLIIAPEGRESVSGALEKGTQGAAYLALKTGVPVIPLTITGSEFRQIENNIRRRIRTKVSVTIGKPFHLASDPGRDGLEEATRVIMEALARQLPARYRGEYS